MMPRAFLVAIVLLTTGLVMAPARAMTPHVLRYTDGLDVATLNPLLATSGNVVGLSRFTMAHLVTVDGRGQPVPELITVIPTQANGGISRDGKTITYRLRHGVKWSDGAPFDADDVAYSLRVVADKTNLIVDHSAYERIASFDEPDKFTIRVRLKEPYAPFVVRAFASAELGCLLPKHLLGASTNINKVSYNGLPVGIGPFRYTAFRRGDAVEMEANPNYFRGLPKLHKISYKIVTNDNTILTQLQTGELDLWADIGGTLVGRVKALPNITLVTAPTLYVSGIYLNLTSPALADVVVRRALRLATDRRFLFEKIAYGVGTLSESVVAPSSDGYADLPRAPYDPDAANKLLDDAGWTRGTDGVRAKGGVRLAVTVALPAGYPPSAQSAELLRAYWQRIGVEASSRSYATAQFFAPGSDGGILATGHFDVALYSYAGSAFADIRDGYGCAFRAPKGFNSSQYCNRLVDADVTAYARSYDARKRAPLAARFQRRVDDDVPTIVTYVRSFGYGATTHLVGLHPTAFGLDGIANMDVVP
ncbi:MAG: peptide ABC transporter substrate-binding protein [Vulcanimicrobiaceae bacterium]